MEHHLTPEKSKSYLTLLLNVVATITLTTYVIYFGYFLVAYFFMEKEAQTFNLDFLSLPLKLLLIGSIIWFGRKLFKRK